MIAKDGFAHLHLHTQYSLLDGAIKLAPLFEQVKALGQRCVGMSDHGNLFGAAEFHEKARVEGVKPIIGCETYIATGSRFEKEKRPQDKSGFDSINHLLLIAQDRTGYKNLMHLVSRGYLEGFYYKPRIDLDLLREHSEGLIATSGCLSSAICRALGSGETRRAFELAEEFSCIFPGRFYVEIQRHGIPLQERVNVELLQIARELKLPLLATNDAHYLHAHDHGPHEALLCVGTGTTLDDPNRFRFDGSGFYVKSAAEMAEVFHDLPEALANTVEITERCTLEIETGIYHMPEFQVPSHTTREAVLREQSWSGLRWRLGLDAEAPLPDSQHIYAERLQMELDVICKMGFEGYFLIVADFIAYAREKSVPVGPGRGSSAGSLVTFSLGITGIDPIEYDILFERFLNPERISMPDIDVDFCMRGRDLVIDYVRRKYDGPTLEEKRVAQIITFGKLQARAALRDVEARAGDPRHQPLRCHRAVARAEGEVGGRPAGETPARNRTRARRADAPRLHARRRCRDRQSTTDRSGPALPRPEIGRGRHAVRHEHGREGGLGEVRLPRPAHAHDHRRRGAAGPRERAAVLLGGRDSDG